MTLTEVEKQKYKMILTNQLILHVLHVNTLTNPPTVCCAVSTVVLCLKLKRVTYEHTRVYFLPGSVS